MFHIEQAESGCGVVTKPIRVKLTFQNISNDPITLHTQFLIGPSSDQLEPPFFNIFPELKTNEGQLISFGVGIVDFLGFSSGPGDFIRVMAGENFETTINFYVPRSAGTNVSPLPGSQGQFLLRFVYLNEVIGPSPDPPSFQQYDWAAWVGKVESNQIVICVQNQ